MTRSPLTDLNKHIPSKDASKKMSKSTPKSTPRKATRTRETYLSVDSGLSLTPKKMRDGTFRWEEDEPMEDSTTPTPSRTRGPTVISQDNEDLLKPAKEEEPQEHSTPVKGHQSFGFGPSGKRTRGFDLDAIEDATTPTKRRRSAEREDSIVVEDADRSSRRQRIRKDLRQMVDDASDEEDVEEDEPESGEEEADRAESVTVVEEDPFNDDGPAYERYFQDLHAKATTSNNTLSKLPPMSHKEYHALLEATTPSHVEETKDLSRLHASLFPQWAFELSSGFNLLCYGYGSKRNLLTRFVREFCTDGPVLIVNGYFPTLPLKEILISIMGAFENDPPSLSGSSIQDQTSHVLSLIDSEEHFPYPALYVLLHNIDGPNLRQPRTQQCLSRLAQNPRVHLVASVDHINAPLMWDSSQGGGAGFNWVWHDATTFESYNVETAFENSMIVDSSQGGGLNIGAGRGVVFVLQSLTKNAKGVFQILAEWQLEQMSENEGAQELASDDDVNMDPIREVDSDEEVTTPSRRNSRKTKSPRKTKKATQLSTTADGLSYDALYTKCREAFLVSGHVAFRAQLTEFRDHKIIRFGKAADGTETLSIPMDQAALLRALEAIVD